MTRASKAMRFFFISAAVLILIGIWLSGFDKVHWFAYTIPVALYFAAATGLCLGLYTSRKILDVFGVKD